MATFLPALVGPEDLHAALQADGGTPPRLLDASTSLSMHFEGEPYSAAPLRDTYLEAHLPGAAVVDVTGEL